MAYEQFPHFRSSHDEQAPALPRQSSADVAAFWIVFGVLTALGLGLSLLYGFVALLADSTTGLAMLWLGWVLLIISPLIGFGLRAKERAAPWLGLIIGVVLYAAGVGGYVAAMPG